MAITTRVLRPRILVYAILLLSLLAGLTWSVNQRVLLRADLLRDRNALYRELPDEMIQNVYTLKLINMAKKTLSVAMWSSCLTEHPTPILPLRLQN